MSLKTKFLKQVFPPLLLSIILTSLISTFLIVYYHDRIINETKEAIFQTEENDMDRFASIISRHFELNLQYLIDDLMAILSYAEWLMQNKKVWNNTKEFIINSYDIATKKINLTDLRGYDDKTNRNYDYSMWYKPGNQSLTTESEREHLEFFKEIDLYLRVFYKSQSKYKLMYAFFEEDGLQYKYPSYESSGFIEFKSNETCEYTESGLTEYFDKRCRFYGKDIKKFLKDPNLVQTILISQPFEYLETGSLGVTACSYNIKDTNRWNFSLIPSEARKLDYAFCMNFDLDELVGSPTMFDLKQLYFFILNKEQVFYHPSFEKKTNGTICNSILACEYGDIVISSEEEKFERDFFNEKMTEIIKNFYVLGNYNTTTLVYKKAGKYYYATVFPIFVSRTGERSNFFLCLIVEPKNLIFEVHNLNLCNKIRFLRIWIELPRKMRIIL